MESIVNHLNNTILHILLLLMSLDIFLSIMITLKNNKWNVDNIKNAILYYTSMTGTSIFLMFVDKLSKINLLFFMGSETLNSLGITKVGIFELFGLIFILFETKRVLKNMIKCDLPIPYMIKKTAINLLEKLTKGGDTNE